MERQNESVHLKFNVDFVLLDIEGTTSSIKFVKDELFPFALSHLRSHLEETWHTEETKDDLTTLLDQIAKDAREANQEPPFDESEAKKLDDSSRAAIIDLIEGSVRRMMADDRKIPALKTLQGHIWSKGYHDGLIKGHTYDDVAPSLRRWWEAGVRLCVYSSGSVHAQRLLFAHTRHGDLTPLISGHFDTTVGQKTSKESYKKIAASLGTSPDNIVFLTDIAAEARAATSAGLRVAVADRPGNSLTLQDGEHYPLFKTFYELHITKANKIESYNLT